MALTKVINDLADLNQSGTTNALKGCAGTTAQQPASSSSIDYLIVGGGGGAGGGIANSWGGGGGGAGGYLTGSTTVYHGTPTVLTVGEGGNGNNVRTAAGFNGDDSGFNGIRAIGGGGGGAESIDAVDGASGGGAGGNLTGTASQPGSSVSGQGNAGGGVASPVNGAASGGGGGGAVGSIPSTSSFGGAGGIGVDQTSFISVVNANLAQIGDTSNATQVMISGGGGGASDYQTGGNGGTGGLGGGGNGGNDGTNSGNGIAGTSNTGGGGGGGNADPSTQALGGTGGSGVGVLKYDNTIVTGYTLNSEDTYTVNWPADKFGVAYWPLNLDVKDVGGYYDGTATDVTYTNGQFNQAAIFNGSSSYIDTTFFWPPISTVSVSIWFNVTTSSPRWTMFGDYDAAGADISGRFSLTIDSSNNFEVNTANGSSSDTWATISASPYFNGAWHHLVMTANGTALKLYLDGILLGSDTSTVSIGTAGAQSLVFGRAGDYNGNYMNGQLEQCRIYTSELSLTDVQDIYNNSKPGSLPPLKTSSDLTTTICNFPSGVTGTALYQFEGTADDSCTVGPYDGIFTNPSYGTGKFGGCAEFNGSTSKIDLPDNILPDNSTANSSASVWFKSTGTLSAQGCILDAWNYDTSEPGWSLFIDQAWSSYPNGQLGLSQYYLNGSSGTSLYGDRDFSDGLWHNAVVVWDNSANTLTLFVDGVQHLQWTGLTASNTWIFTQKSAIGYQNANPASPRYFNGEIDQLRIYNVALTDQQVYDLWQKENDIQTYITNTTSSTDANGTPANTDILVFKEGSGEITFKNDTPPGAEVGMLRYNSTLGQMEHFNSGGWKDFTNCTTSMCNYPITARCLYTFNGNYNDLCGNTTPDLIQNVYYTPGKFDKLGWNVLGLSSYLGYSKIGWSSGLIADYNATDFSISLWLKLNAYGGASALQYPYIWSGWSNAYWSLHMANTSAANTISFGSWSSADGSQEVHSGIVALDTWYHIVCTRSTTTGIQLYLNNVLISTLGTVYNAQAASVYDMMGGYGDTGYTRQGLDGTISQFRLFEAVLTPTQISQLYNEASCPNT